LDSEPASNSGFAKFEPWQRAGIVINPLTDDKGLRRLLHLEGGELDRVFDTVRAMSWQNFGRKIRFYGPSFLHYEVAGFSSDLMSFPSISVTGDRCALNCAHCGGRILQTMIPATSPERLEEVCGWLKRSGCSGFLLSGGCGADGSVPLGKFLDSIGRVKRRLNLTVVVHTGIVRGSIAKKLREAGVDAALIDVVGADETIRQVLHLDATVEDYERSLEKLADSGIPLIPHVLVGLHQGMIVGELEALTMISRHRPRALVVIVFTPIRGTEMEKVVPPTPDDVARVLVSGRLLLPQVPIALGCVRPSGEHRAKTDVLAVKTGVNAIAFPRREAIDAAGSMGVELSFSRSCCSQIYKDILG